MSIMMMSKVKKVGKAGGTFRQGEGGSKIFSTLELLVLRDLALLLPTFTMIALANKYLIMKWRSSWKKLIDFARRRLGATKTSRN